MSTSLQRRALLCPADTHHAALTHNAGPRQPAARRRRPPRHWAAGVAPPALPGRLGVVAAGARCAIRRRLPPRAPRGRWRRVAAVALGPAQALAMRAQCHFFGGGSWARSMSNRWRSFQQMPLVGGWGGNVRVCVPLKTAIHPNYAKCQARRSHQTIGACCFDGADPSFASGFRCSLESSKSLSGFPCMLPMIANMLRP